ncbi:hypothetical protein GCM10008090_31940 [Arenicella chitinivorans]|uniref:Beta-lactamase-related domain-containing protein n=2 Tax=Arenicella chitinivorans TaxID=1329800 RepID=A0A918S0U2_9GAMM|nr:hypothetical protein GCM10008090_31940 [Arenicella chitinivorans]
MYRQLCISLICFISFSGSLASERQGFQIPRTEIVPIENSATGGLYELYIKLPNTYSDGSEDEYPVIYFTDADWHIELLSAAQEYLLEEVILVGISWQKDMPTRLLEEVGPHVSRFRDYTLLESSNADRQSKYQFGNAGSHLRFIREDVITHVEKHYRANSHNRSYFGYSAGGLFGSYIAIARPDTFKNYLLGSPSLDGDIPYLTELLEKSESSPAKMDANIYITHGSLEKGRQGYIDQYIALLNSIGDETLSVSKVQIEGSHQTAFPMTGVRGVTWLSNLINEALAEQTEVTFRDIAPLKLEFVDASPADLNDSIPVGVLGHDASDRRRIMQIAHEIADQKHARVDSLLIAHKGKLLFESYYLRGRRNMPHPQASATKAYTGLALGRAIQMGYMTMEDLHRPVISFLTDLDKNTLVEGAELVTLHHALTMTSGLRIPEGTLDELEKNPKQLQGQGLIQAYFEHSETITPQSQTFLYQGTDPSMVMHVLETVVPGSAKQFIEQEVLTKLGITTFDWNESVSGLPSAGSGSAMTSRDMLKWGMLVANKGSWQGEQLIPEAYLDIGTNKVIHIEPDDIFFTNSVVTNPGYGYFWWQADLEYDGKRYFSRSAQGGGGQYIILIDELDLMVVTTGHDREMRPLRLTAERILPAFIK